MGLDATGSTAYPDAVTGSPRSLVRGLGIALVSAAAVLAAQVPVPAAQTVAVAAAAEESDTARLLRQYLTGDADDAVDGYMRTLAGDPYHGTSFGPGARPGSRNPEYRELLGWLLLRTEAGMRARIFGKYAMSAPLESAKHDIGLTGMFELNSLSAYRSIEDLLSLAKGEPRYASIDANSAVPHLPESTLPPEVRPQVIDAIRSWYIVTTSYCLRGQLDCADALLAAARQSLGPDPEILLLAGAVAESHHQATAARALTRQAIAGDASLAEAHLRLGRLLAAAGRAIEGRRELDRALAGARKTGDMFVVYFASLSLADLDERAGRKTSAKAHAADAAAVTPFADPLFAGIQPDALYDAAEFYQQPKRIAALRAMVRR